MLKSLNTDIFGYNINRCSMAENVQQRLEKAYALFEERCRTGEIFSMPSYNAEELADLMEDKFGYRPLCTGS